MPLFIAASDLGVEAARRSARLIYQLGQKTGMLYKAGSDSDPAVVLAGRFYVSASGWGLLSVPNALVRGLFDAMDEQGVELPPSSDGRLNAHVSVMTRDEVERIGSEAITERGHSYRYQLGPVKVVTPKGWDEMSRCWFVEVRSPELSALRKSYGLTPLPCGDHQFHITFAVRRKKVLHGNDVSKAASGRHALEGPDVKTATDLFGPYGPISQTIGGWLVGNSAQPAPRPGKPPVPTPNPAPAPVAPSRAGSLAGGAFARPPAVAPSRAGMLAARPPVGPPAVASSAPGGVKRGQALIDLLCSIQHPKEG